jgi:hypothetical protein
MAKTYTTFEGLADFHPFGQSGKKIFGRSSRNDTKNTHRRIVRLSAHREVGRKADPWRRGARREASTFSFGETWGGWYDDTEGGGSSSPRLGPGHRIAAAEVGELASVAGRRLGVCFGELAETVGF